LTLCPTYLGIAQAAFDFTAAYLRGEAPGSPGRGPRQSPTKQLAVGEMRLKLEQAKALFYRAVTEARLDPPKDVRVAVPRLELHRSVDGPRRDLVRSRPDRPRLELLARHLDIRGPLRQVPLLVRQRREFLES
jgi:hypothetical protein